MKSFTFLHLIIQLYSSWTVSKSLKFTHLSFHWRSTQINTEIHKNTLTQVTILGTFIKSDILTQPLTPPKNYAKNFENQKMNATTQPPPQILHFINILLPPNAKCLYFLRYGPISVSIPQFFSPSIFEQYLNFPKSFLIYYPQLKLNQNSPKDPKLILFLTMKLLYTYFWLTLPTGALIWVALIWVAFFKRSQIASPPQITYKVWQIL